MLVDLAALGKLFAYIKGKASTSVGTVDPRPNIHGNVDLRAA
jgi:hypothetical protein